MRTHTDVHGRVPAPGGGGASEYVVSFKIRDLSRSGDGGGGRTKAHGSRRPVCAGCAGCIRHGCGRSKSGRQPLGDTHPLQRRAPKPRCAPVQTSDDPVPKDEKPAEQAQDADPAELVLPAGHAVQAANVPGVSANVFAGQTGNRKCAATERKSQPGRAVCTHGQRNAQRVCRAHTWARKRKARPSSIAAGVARAGRRAHGARAAGRAGRARRCGRQAEGVGRTDCRQNGPARMGRGGFM